MSTEFLLGIDVGTSTCKAVVTDVDAAERAIGRRATPWQPDGLSLDPSDLIGAVLSAVNEALDAVPSGRVLGVGVASMAEAGVLLNADSEPAAPILAWRDERAAGELNSLRADLPSFSRRTGLRVSAKPVAVKHRWRTRRDGRAATASRWLNMAEYVVFALGGDQVAEPSLASRTGWLDVARRAWWPEALAWSGAHESLLPPLVEAGHLAGRVARADRLRGAALTVAGHDHLVAAIGAGAVENGDLIDSCGSAEALIRAVDPASATAVRADAAAAGVSSGWHVLPDRCALISGFRSGGQLRDLLDEFGLDDPAAADELARTGRLQRWSDTVDAIAREAARRADDLQRFTGPPDRLVAVGGWARDGLVAEARERYLGPAEHPPVAEAAARGAAVLAGVAAGVFTDVTTVSVGGPAGRAERAGR